MVAAEGMSEAVLYDHGMHPGCKVLTEGLGG